MAEPRGHVIHWDLTGDTPKLFYLSDLHFSTLKVEWSEDAAAAWSFETFRSPDGTVDSDAEKQACALRAAGMQHVSAVVVVAEEAVVEARGRRRQNAVDQAEASVRVVDPTGVYRENCRRLGEREDRE